MASGKVEKPIAAMSSSPVASAVISAADDEKYTGSSA